MSSNCYPDLGGNFVVNCNHIPKAGILRKWIGIHDDIDQQATTIAENDTSGNVEFGVNQLVLKANAAIYRVEGNDKVHKLKDEAAENDFVDGHIHTDTITFVDKSQAEFMRVNRMKGRRFFSIVETVDSGGDGLTKFLIGGLESGMKMSANDFDTAENSATRTVELKTQENALESKTVIPLFLTDGTATDATPATTLTALEALEYAGA